jgi:nucleoside-diphosphate-sugar epimerase
VLITGDRGYLGSVVAPFLERAGHSVVRADAGFYDACGFGPQPDGAAPRRDLRDPAARSVARGIDAVVHLAALSNDPLGDLDRSLTFAINLDATVALARAAREAGATRFVFASSCSMYGAGSGDEILDERAPISPLTAYAETKALAEERLLELADSSFAPVFMRNATVYGASPRLRLDVVLNNLAAWAHTTGRIKLLSDGSSWRPLVHVDDVAAATALVLEAPAELVRGEAFNVGSASQNVRIRDLAGELRDQLGCDVELSAEAVVDPRSYRVDFSKLAQVFPGFRCAWSIERGVAQLAEAYERNGLTREQFEGGRYTRLAELRRLLDSGELDADLRWQAAAAAAAVVDGTARP